MTAEAKEDWHERAAYMQFMDEDRHYWARTMGCDDCQYVTVTQSALERDLGREMLIRQFLWMMVLLGKEATCRVPRRGHLLS